MAILETGIDFQNLGFSVIFWKEFLPPSRDVVLVSRNIADDSPLARRRSISVVHTLANPQLSVVKVERFSFSSLKLKKN